MALDLTLTVAEQRLAVLIWREAPLTSPELVIIAEREMDWNKSTTYTVLRKLCKKGVFKNENANVSIVLTQDELIAQQSRRYVEDAFGGSLPKFITTFLGGGGISEEQADELTRLIEAHKGGGDNK